MVILLTGSNVSNAELGEWLLSGSWVSSHLTASHPPQVAPQNQLSVGAEVVAVRYTGTLLRDTRHNPIHQT